MKKGLAEREEVAAEEEGGGVEVEVESILIVMGSAKVVWEGKTDMGLIEAGKAVSLSFLPVLPRVMDPEKPIPLTWTNAPEDG